MVDLVSVVLPKVKMEDEEGDLYKEHMVVINGWRKLIISLLLEPIPKLAFLETYNNSSPPEALSCTSSQSQEEIDELELQRFLLSSPNTDIDYVSNLTAKLGSLHHYAIYARVLTLLLQMR